MRKKSTTAILLAFVLCLALTGCKSKAVQRTEDKINDIGSVSIDSEAAIRAARAEYDDLKEKDQEKVENYPVLEYAETELEALKVEALIRSIGEVSLESEETIQEARDAYDSQPSEVQNIVQNVETLEQAEKNYETLCMQNRAAKLDAQILEIGKVSMQNEDAVDEAKATWDAMSEEEKTYVQNADILAEAVKALADLRDETALQEVQRLTSNGSYQEAIDFAEAYIGEKPQDEVSDRMLKACVRAYVMLSQEQERAHHNEAAERTLNLCLERYAGTEAVKDAENAQEKLQKKLEMAIPKNGTVLKSYAKGGHGELTVKNGGSAAVIKLASLTDPDTNYITMYIAANDTATVHVKDGNYSVKYATGAKWYGEEELFGEQTVYTKADTTAKFETTYSGSYVYYNQITYTLYEVAEGNMSTTEISGEDF